MAANQTATEDQRAARLQENRNKESQGAEETEPEAGAQPQPRYINGAEAVFLVLFAAGCDLATFVAGAVYPPLGSVIGGIVWLTFYLWIKSKQMKGAPQTWSRLLTMAGFLEIIPVISALPTWIGFTILIIIADKIGRLPFFENLLQFPRLTRL